MVKISEVFCSGDTSNKETYNPQEKLLQPERDTKNTSNVGVWIPLSEEKA